MSPASRAALLWVALGPGLWAVAEATYAPRLAGLVWAVSAAAALALGGRRPWLFALVTALGAAVLGRAWSGA